MDSNKTLQNYKVFLNGLYIYSLKLLQLGFLKCFPLLNPIHIVVCNVDVTVTIPTGAIFCG